MRAALPADLAAELNISRSSHSKVRVEAAVVCGRRDRATDYRGRLGKIRMVKGVKERSPEFKGISLAELEGSLHGDVPISQAGGYDRITGTIAKYPGTGRRRGERAGIDVRPREICQLVMKRADAIRPFV